MEEQYEELKQRYEEVQAEWTDMRTKLEELDRMNRALHSRNEFLEKQVENQKQEIFNLKQQITKAVNPQLGSELLQEVWDALYYKNMEHGVFIPVTTDDVYTAYSNNCKIKGKTPDKRNTIWRRLLELTQGGWVLRTQLKPMELWLALKR